MARVQGKNSLYRKINYSKISIFGRLTKVERNLFGLSASFNKNVALAGNQFGTWNPAYRLKKSMWYHSFYSVSKKLAKKHFSSLKVRLYNKIRHHENMYIFFIYKLCKA